MKIRNYNNERDPLEGASRSLRLSVYRAWYEEKAYSHANAETLYPLKDGTVLRLWAPIAGIITNKHIGLEINQPPQFKVGNAKVQTWLNRVFKLNGLRGSMRAAAITKSWAGDVGILFAYKPTERSIFGTSWQVGFIQPETYEVTERYGSGVFKAVDIYTFEDRPDPAANVDPRQTPPLRRWWRRTEYRARAVTTWPEVEGSLDDPIRPPAQEFVNALAVTGQEPQVQDNSMGVIPFVVVQNISADTQDWQGASDYQHITHLFHRLNVHLDSVEQGEQIKNKLMLALIDAEEVTVKTGNGVTALDVKSNEDGTTDRQAQVMPTPLLGGNGGTQLQFFSSLLDLAFERAGVAQTGSAKELFGNEAASSSALKTFYGMQTAVATHKRENWLGERVDYGMSGLVRKMLRAAQAVDPAPLGITADTDLDAEDFDLTLDWPEMFALSAPERQTEASVAQQANDDGLPAEIVARLWGKVLDATSPREQKLLTAAIQEHQDKVAQGMAAPPPQRGILGSGQGDGLGEDGGSVTKPVVPR